ncbi:MAG: cytosolic protein, partial [Deltaproteobacteria bacterium HGW-Deltaproteobacteria-21]
RRQNMHEFLEELKKDHQEVKDILEKLKSSGGEKSREKLFLELKKEIQPHMKAEEKAFYTILTKEKESKENALEGFEEHHVTEMVLKELDKMGKAEERWLAKMKVFAELVDHHVEEEESKIFQDAQSVLDDEQMDEILEEFNEQKEQLRKKIK